MHLVALFFLVLTPSVETSPVFDAYDPRISVKQENARLDNYAIQVKAALGSRALIVVYAENEKTVASVKARARRAMKYLVKTRRLNPARVMWRFEAVCTQNVIVLYLLYGDQADPAPDPKCIR